MTDAPHLPFVRIKDVAALAGVSTATVSRALSRPAMVSEATRQAVQDAVAATGYRINHSARNLRMQRTGSILALTPNLANPFFSEILYGISTVLRGAGLNLLVADTQVDAAARDRLVDYADRSRADGLIVLDGLLDPAIFGRARCPPVVQVCEWNSGLKAPSIRADNAAGAEMAVAHLIALGHTRLAHLTGPVDNPLTIARRTGVSRALIAAGLPPEPAWTLSGDFTMASGQAAGGAMIADTRVWHPPDKAGSPRADGPPCGGKMVALASTALAGDDATAGARPTAVFCDSDAMAIGLIGAVQKAGVAIPGALSVAGFDGIELSAHITPALTTIRQPRRRLGAAAAETMLARLADRTPPSETVIPVEILIRDSTAPPR